MREKNEKTNVIPLLTTSIIHRPCDDDKQKEGNTVCQLKREKEADKGKNEKSF